MMGTVNVCYLILVAVISPRVPLLLCWNPWTVFVVTVMVNLPMLVSPETCHTGPGSHHTLEGDPSSREGLQYCSLCPCSAALPLNPEPD